MFRILRVVYSRPIGQLLVSLPVVHPVSYQTFAPRTSRPDMPDRRDEESTRRLVKSPNELDFHSTLRVRRLDFVVDDLTQSCPRVHFV